MLRRVHSGGEVYGGYDTAGHHSRPHLQQPTRPSRYVPTRRGWHAGRRRYATFMARQLPLLALMSCIMRCTRPYDVLNHYIQGGIMWELVLGPIGRLAPCKSSEGPCLAHVWTSIADCTAVCQIYRYLLFDCY